MNPLFPLITAGAMYTTPIAPQVYYIANLSETDGSRQGEYITITPISPVQNPVQTITPLVIEPVQSESSED